MTELNFKGKEFVYNHHLSVPFRPLIPHADKSIGEPDLSGNLIIQGDNLHGLKSLLPLYAGKVDCIFIDPPYNTGNEDWAYNDNVNAPMIKEWLESNPIGIDDGLRHDKWCAMMWPRMRMLHELLADDGSIWITLDDHEIHRAKNLLNEIFGEEQFVVQIAVQSNKRGQTYKSLAKTHEYILVYSKTQFTVFHELETNGSNLPDLDEYGSFSARELRNRNPKFGKHNRPNLFYPIYINPKPVGNGDHFPVSLDPKNGYEETFPINSKGGESCWRWGQQRTIDKTLNESTEHLFAKKTREGEWRIFEKYRKESVKAKTIWLDSKHISEQGTVELGEIGLADEFQFPKPLGLLQDVLAIATDENSLILDSFAGSGTTANAVLRANKLDGGNRNFILIEMEDYADKLTAERIRRVINGYNFKGTHKTELLRKKLNWSVLEKFEKLTQKVEAIENLHGHEYDKISKTIKDSELIVIGEKSIAEKADGLGGSFTYCTLGEPLELDAILQGKNLPSFDALGSVLFHMATNQTLDNKQLEADKFYLGETQSQHVWLIYRDDVEWLKSPNAALTLSFAQDISKSHPDKPHLVFAPARFASSKVLSEQGLNVEFVPLPFALYRLERD